MSMAFRAIDGDGDWYFGQGSGSYFRDQDAIAANIRTRVLFFLNDFFAAMNQGIDWNNLLGSKNPQALQNILLQTRATIANSYGVVKINSVKAETDPRSRQATLTFDIDTIFTQNYTDSVTTIA